MKWIALIVFIFAGMIETQARAQETALQETVLASQFYQNKDFANAEKSAQAAVALDPNYAPAHQMLGNVYVGENRIPDALTEYQKSLTIQPDNAALKAYVQNLQASMPPATPVVQASATAVATAAPTQVGFSPDKPHGVFSAYGGFYLIGSGFSAAASEGTTYDTGADFGAYAGFAFDRHFSTGFKFNVADFDYQEGSYGSSQVYQVNYQNVALMMSSRYVFFDSGLRPYLTFATGVDLVSTVVANEPAPTQSDTTVVPLIEGGIGVTYPISKEFDVYAEVDYDVLPIVIYGVDNTVSFVPINLGLQFNVY